jgi:hypothetical protein
MTPYELGFLKTARAKLSDSDVEALREMMAQQKENARQRELRRTARFDKNRKERVRDAKNYMMIILGLAGFMGGRLAGGAIGKSIGQPGDMTHNKGALIGSLSGLVAGGIGGRYFGEGAGNRTADRMEQIEKDTGIRVNEQETENLARTTNNLMLYNTFFKH